MACPASLKVRQYQPDAKSKPALEEKFVQYVHVRTCNAQPSDTSSSPLLHGQSPKSYIWLLVQVSHPRKAVVSMITKHDHQEILLDFFLAPEVHSSGMWV